MSVYIKGMEMPKAGNWKTIRIYSDGTCVEPNQQGDCAYMKGYEAIPVPEHGKLLDRDAVLLDDGPYEYDEWCKWALEQYLNAPTIIPADKEEQK